MLTEARVIIPDGQALLGFQFVCRFTRSFKGLPPFNMFMPRAYVPLRLQCYC